MYNFFACLSRMCGEEKEAKFRYGKRVNSTKMRSSSHTIASKRGVKSRTFHWMARGKTFVWELLMENFPFSFTHKYMHAQHSSRRLACWLTFSSLTSAFLLCSIFFFCFNKVIDDLIFLSSRSPTQHSIALSSRAYTRDSDILIFSTQFPRLQKQNKKKTIEKLVWTERWRLSILSIKAHEWVIRYSRVVVAFRQNRFYGAV